MTRFPGEDPFYMETLGNNQEFSSVVAVTLPELDKNGKTWSLKSTS